VLTDVEATHRGLHKFTGRHSDEIDIDIGDPVYVQQEADDCWCDGINLRTQRRGIFPAAYVVDVDYDFDPDGRRVNKERYALDFLGSVETMVNKGEQVICSAVERMRKSPVTHPQPCFLEISDQGLHVMDKCKENDVRVLSSSLYFVSINSRLETHTTDGPIPVSRLLFRFEECHVLRVSS
jgi:mitogen-activated protein kinase 8 interacting protein 1